MSANDDRLEIARRDLLNLNVSHLYLLPPQEQRQQFLDEMARSSPSLPSFVFDALFAGDGFGTIRRGCRLKIADSTCENPNAAQIATQRSWVSIIHDVTGGTAGAAQGPVGYNKANLRWLLCHATMFAVEAGVGEPFFYGAIQTAAEDGGRVVLVITEPKQYASWERFLSTWRPDAVFSQLYDTGGQPGAVCGLGIIGSTSPTEHFETWQILADAGQTVQ